MHGKKLIFVKPTVTKKQQQ